MQVTTTTGNLIFLPTNNNQIEVLKSNVSPRYVKEQHIYKAQRAVMLDKYRQYVDAFNKKTAKANQEVENYNQQVKIYIEKNELQETATLQQTYFDTDHAKVSVMEYNQAIEAINQQEGELLLLKQRHKRVPKPIEATFTAILFCYSLQLEDFINSRKQLNVTTTSPIRKVRVNHTGLANTEINGVSVLPYDKKTIYNHVQRLIHAGVLFDYEFCGHQRPVNFHVNNEILTLFDSKTKKILNAQNQLFNYEVEKNFPHKSSDTSTLKDKLKINATVDSSQLLIKGTIDFSSTSSTQTLQENQSISDYLDASASYLNTKLAKNSQEKTTPPPQKICAISENFREEILQPQDLCEHLAVNSYQDYRFLTRKQLELEIYQGNLTKEEYRELLLQTFLKTAAPMFKDVDTWTATWRLAYNSLNKNELKNPNGSIPGKVNLLYKFDNLIWRITYAKQYFKRKPEINLYRPAVYFDSKRTIAKSLGFAYTLQILKQNEAAKEAIMSKKTKRAAMVAKRNHRLKAIELMERKISEVKNHKTTIEQALEWLHSNGNLPKDIKKRFPMMVTKVFTNN